MLQPRRRLVVAVSFCCLSRTAVSFMLTSPRASPARFASAERRLSVSAVTAALPGRHHRRCRHSLPPVLSAKSTEATPSQEQQGVDLLPDPAGSGDSGADVLGSLGGGLAALAALAAAAGVGILHPDMAQAANMLSEGEFTVSCSWFPSTRYQLIYWERSLVSLHVLTKTRVGFRLLSYNSTDSSTTVQSVSFMVQSYPNSSAPVVEVCTTPRVHQVCHWGQMQTTVS